MFTGIIEQCGQVKRVQRDSRAARFEIGHSFEADSIAPGDSIACNGVCLTATDLTRNSFSAEASLETLRCTSLGQLQSNSKLHLERALRVGDRLGGHWVSGHVDGVGSVKSCVAEGDSQILSVEIPAELRNFVVMKGSIAFDGVSLTVSGLKENLVSVTLVPFTIEHTLLTKRPIGTSINIEVDMIARYVVQYLAGLKQGGGIDLDFLKKNGFA